MPLPQEISGTSAAIVSLRENVGLGEKRWERAEPSGAQKSLEDSLGLLIWQEEPHIFKAGVGGGVFKSPGEYSLHLFARHSVTCCVPIALLGLWASSLGGIPS